MIALFRKEWLEVSRTKKLLILSIIFLFVAISSPILAKLIPTIFKNINTAGITLNIPDPTWRDAIDQFIKNLGQIAMIVVVFVFAGSLAEEKNKKTLEMLLTKPVRRSNLILAKLTTAICSTAAIYIIGALIFYAYTVSLFGSFAFIDFALMAVLLLLYLLQAVAVTIFASTITSNQIIAAGTAFFFEIIVVTVLGSIDAISKYAPGYILGHYREIMSGNYDGFLPSTLLSIALIVLAFFGAIAIFRRQEIDR